MDIIYFGLFGFMLVMIIIFGIRLIRADKKMMDEFKEQIEESERPFIDKDQLTEN